MNDSQTFVEFEVELDKAHVEFLDQEAARLGRTRNDVLCQAVDAHLDRIGRLFKEWNERRQREGEASRTGHTAKKPPTPD
jgi:hypothetical protein